MDAPTTSLPVETMARRRGSTFTALLEELRPQQWVKNGFVFAALIFSQSLARHDRLVKVTLAAVVFCLASSAAYVLNDILDVAEDRHHPVKRLRPIASGRINATTAAIAGVVIAMAALAEAWRIDSSFFGIVITYLSLNVFYSIYLKKIMLLDVFIVASGFLLRVIAGGLVIHVAISSWLIVCTTLLALFIALCKRRHELALLGNRASDHRTNLTNYTPYFLDQLIGIVTASTVVSYALYTLSNDVPNQVPRQTSGDHDSFRAVWDFPVPPSGSPP